MMESFNVSDLRWRIAGLSLEQAAALCGVSVRTIRRWEQQGAAPVWFARLLALYSGEVGALPGADGWQGWRVVRGLLVSPEGDLFRPGQLRGLRWVYGELQELRRLTRPGAQLALDLSISEYRPFDTDQPARRRGNSPPR